jgi:hypothetical protein
MEFEKGSYYLGRKLDIDSGEATDELLQYDSGNLTTHGVIVGMTGSGKTGLGIDLIEEALLSEVPCLIIDPKGDMGNLLLSFPDFQPSDFRPWIDEGEAKREGKTPDELATSKADLWKSGLEKSGITGERLRQLNRGSDITIYTPGSSAGVGLNVLGSLAAPDIDWDKDAEIARDEIEGFVSSLLLLADIDSDPVSDPRHILLASIIEKAWVAGSDLDLASLVGQVPKPPFRKLGVFELDTFFPEKDRMALAMRLNGLLASPSFSSWLEGDPLDIEHMLHGPGPTKAAIVYMAHLSETERQFMVTLLLSKMITWFRTQQGTSDLRALVYMDEVFGYVPPVREPPTKKPILTILKQARAFGVGMVLSTQNPVDIDYKALSNAGTWMIGRLQTETDKKRLLEGLASASGVVDVAIYDKLISGLDKRQFVLHSTHEQEPVVFATRWAQSFLAGPLVRDQVSDLMTGRRNATDAPTASGSAGETPQTAAPTTPETPDTRPADEGSVPVMPAIAPSVATYGLDAAAPWAASIGASMQSRELHIGAAATVQLLYDDTPSQVNHQETYEAVIFPLKTILSESDIHTVDHDQRDFTTDIGASPLYSIPDVDIESKTFWSDLEKDLKGYLVANRTVRIFKNPGLKLYSRVGESEEDFVARCREAASDAADAELSKLKDKYKTRIDRVRDQISGAESRVRELADAASAKKQSELMTGVGDLLTGLLGGRKASSALSKAASRRSATRAAESKAETASDALNEKISDLQELEAELETDVAEITTKYDELADEIETVEIGLEATDVRVAELKAVWIPT